MKGLPGSSALIRSARTAAPTTPAAFLMNERRFKDRSALLLFCRLMVCSLSLLLFAQVGDQIGHILGLKVLLQSVRHRRLARARQLLQVGPQDDLPLAGRTNQGDAAATLLDEDAGEYFPLSSDRRVIKVAGL